MLLYLSIIAVAVLVIAGVTALITSLNFLPILGFTALAALIAMVVNGLTATVCRLLPKKCADADKKRFIVSAREKKFYEKMKIRKWKDKVPEIGQFTGFRKNKLDDPKSVEYLDRFLLETAYGEIGHFTSFFTSFLILLFFPVYELWFAVAIPVAAVAALFNVPSFMILRYNSYKLRVLRDANLKKLRRAQAVQEQAAENK